MRSLLLLIVLAALLGACRPGTPTTAPGPSPTVAAPTATAVPTGDDAPTATPAPADDTPSVTPAPTDEPPSASPTAEPTATPTSAPSAPRALAPGANPDAPLMLPDDLSLLQWVEEDASEGRLRRLDGWEATLASAQPMPDGGRWWATEVYAINESPGPGPAPTALLVLDTQGNEHWLASRTTADQWHEWEWLPDGRLLWADGGELFIAQADGTERRALGAPDPVLEVWGGASGVAVASGTRAVWRVSLADGTWEDIETLVLPNESLTTAATNLSVSPDGSVAAINAIGTLWRVPLTMGTPAEAVVQFEYPGRGGRISAPQPLADSPLWYQAEVVQGQTIGGALVDPDAGTLQPVTALLSDANPQLGAQVSPDGRWFTLRAGDGNITVPDDVLYVIQSSDLSLVAQVPVQNFLTWGSDGASALLVGPGEAGVELQRLSLPDGDVTSLRPLDPDIWPTVASSDEVIYLFNQEGVVAVALDGTGLGTLPDTVATPQLYAATADGVLFSDTSRADSPLWLWAVD